VRFAAHRNCQFQVGLIALNVTAGVCYDAEVSNSSDNVKMSDHKVHYICDIYFSRWNHHSEKRHLCPQIYKSVCYRLVLIGDGMYGRSDYVNWPEIDEDDCARGKYKLSEYPGWPLNDFEIEV
jgi:hypothetical protein